MTKANIPARALATRLLAAHKQFLPAELTCATGCKCPHFDNKQRRDAVKMLTTHIEATRRLGTPGCLKAAATDTIFMVSLNETAYEPLPGFGAAGSSALSEAQAGIWAHEL
ncbi:MAG: hypothetical protein ACKV2V_24185 [Blastocatellia bacterium]